MNENNPAEIVEELVKAISDQDYVDNIKLQKNAVIDGKTGSHPIDLYWEFTDGSIVYKTLISVKPLNTVAVRSDIISLADVIRDVYGQTTGVLFSRPIYDKDVRIMAENVGISLCEMMPPLPEVWEPIVENFQIKADEEFVKKEKARLGVTEQISVKNDNARQLFLYNQNFECTDTVGSIISPYVDKADPPNFDKREISHTFQEPVYLQTGHEVIPFVKISGISFTLGFKLVHKMSDEDKEQEGKDLIEYILHNISRFIETS